MLWQVLREVGMARCGWSVLLLVLLASTAANDDNTPLPPNQNQKRRIARVEGDIILGALFPVHRQPPQKIAYTRQCGEIWEQYGMHRIEIFLKTLDEINAARNILPNITLGADIRDSCWYAPVALEQSIDFIKNSIASMEKGLNKSGRGDECNQAREKPIAGLIGPGSSTVTIQIQNLLSLFTIPQIGYSATSKDLSDKSLYKYFLRVVPSDKLQARAMLDIVKHYNWTYVSTVYTEGNYGLSGMLEFSKMAKEEGICEATAEKVQNNADDESYDQIIRTLTKYEAARVVICFCEGMTVKGLLKATKRLKVEGQFLFIGSDGWAVRPDVVKDNEEAAVGGMSMKLYSPAIHDFDDHYFSLRPHNNTRNPWFREFWQERFKCQLSGPDRDERFHNWCTGREDLSKDYVQDAKLGFVVNAIYTMAYALDNMHRQVCGGRPGLCQQMNPVNGSIFMDYLLNVSFHSYSNNMIEFDRKGDPPGRYRIMNFQRVKRNGRTEYDYVMIGGWDSGNLTIHENKIFWPVYKNRSVMVESVCSKPCPKGHIKAQKGGQVCCWLCTLCKPNEFLLDESTCDPCPPGWWPNEELTACKPIPVEHIQWGDTEAVVAIVFSCVGVISTVFVTVIFVRHNNTSVVKASTRELSYIILLGISIGYVTTFPLVAKPSQVTCYMVRILPGFSFALIYGALVTKTNRIARILAGSKKKIMTRKPRFMSAIAQVVITFIIIGIESAIITTMLILEPANSILIYPTQRRVRLACNTTTLGIIVPLGFDVFLIVMCTLYAIKTRNVPENFNEAKFIGFSMYTTCVIWLAFVPIYFGSDNKVITMCLAITLSASVALILLFFPKIYIIICKPEKNNRSAFTTSKDVRCHIGNQAGRSYSASNDSFERQISGRLMSKKQGRSVFPWRRSVSRSTEAHPREKHKTTLPSSPRGHRRPWEKSFEGAAVALYRQKSFFTRWKHKSLTEDMKPPNGQSGRRTGQAYPGRGGASRPNSVVVPDSQRTRSFRENIAMRDESVSTYSTPTRGSKRSREYNPGAASPVGSRYSWGSQRTVSTEGDVIESRLARPNSFTDSSAQTTDDLLQAFVYGLRRRAVKSDSNASSRSMRSVTSVMEVDEEDDALPLRRSLRDSRRGRHAQELMAVINRGHVDDDACETDRLLIEDSKITDSDKSFLHIEDYTPLIDKAAKSKALAGQTNRLSTCDTTSEDTLSEGHIGSLDDIEDLLSGVGSRDDTSPSSPYLRDRNVDSSMSGEWFGTKVATAPETQVWPAAVVGAPVEEAVPPRRFSGGTRPPLLSSSRVDRPESIPLPSLYRETSLASRQDSLTRLSSTRLDSMTRLDSATRLDSLSRHDSVKSRDSITRLDSMTNHDIGRKGSITTKLDTLRPTHDSAAASVPSRHGSVTSRHDSVSSRPDSVSSRQDNGMRLRQSSTSSAGSVFRQPPSPEELTVVSIGVNSQVEPVPPPQPACVVGMEDSGALQYYKQSPSPPPPSSHTEPQKASQIQPPGHTPSPSPTQLEPPLSSDITPSSPSPFQKFTSSPLPPSSSQERSAPTQVPSASGQERSAPTQVPSASGQMKPFASTQRQPTYDPAKVAKLKEYLWKTKGVDVDLTKILSSDV